MAPEFEGSVDKHAAVGMRNGTIAALYLYLPSIYRMRLAVALSLGRVN